MDTRLGLQEGVIDCKGLPARREVCCSDAAALVRLYEGVTVGRERVAKGHSEADGPKEERKTTIKWDVNNVI